MIEGTPARPRSAGKTDTLVALVETIPSLFFKLKTLTEALHTDDALSTPERGILRDLVDRGAMSAPQLAALRPVSRQAIQPVIDRLLARGFVTSVPNPRHARSPLYEAARDGRQLMRVVRRREAAALADAAVAFSADQLAVSLDTLVKLETILARALEA